MERMDQFGAEFNQQVLIDQARAMTWYVEQAARTGQATHQVEAGLCKQGDGDGPPGAGPVLSLVWCRWQRGSIRDPTSC